MKHKGHVRTGNCCVLKNIGYLDFRATYIFN